MADLTFDPLGASTVSDAAVSWAGGTTKTIDIDLNFIYSDAAATLSTPYPKYPEYRVIVVNMDGSPIAELAQAIPGVISEAVAGSPSWDFTIPTNDPFSDLCKALENEVQVYRGNQLMFWGVMLRHNEEGRWLRVQCEGLDYYFTRRVIGRVPKRNLLNDLNKYPEWDGRPANWSGWEYVSLPRSTPRNPPGHQTDPDIRYNEHRSFQLTGSTGRETKTRANSDLFSGDNLTTTGRNWIINNVISDMGTRMLTVNVFDDNQQTKAESIRRAKARAESIVDAVQDYDSEIKVQAIGYGYKKPKESNSTSGGRTANRRTTFVYRNDDGKNSQKQVARKFFTVRNPDQGQKKKQYTLSTYVYLDNVAGLAARFAGIELIRYDPKKKHKDPKWRKEGYKKPKQVSTAALGKGTSQGTWIRLTATVTLPNDGKKSLLEARLYAPNGDAYFSECWMSTNDSHWYKNEEQAEIVRDLVAHAQDESMGKSDLGIEMNVPDTGIKRTREYLWQDRFIVYDALNEFQTLADGMEWDIVCTPTSRTFTTYYPRKGKDTQVVLANDSNLSEYTVDIDGTQISTTVIIGNDGNDFSREERSVQDPSIMAGLVLEKAYLKTPNSPATSWRKQAERGLARYRRPVVIPKVKIAPDFTQEMLEKVAVGDRVMTLIHDDWIDTAQKYRVTERRLDPRTDTIEFSLYPEDINIRVLAGFNAGGWKYLHQDQKPIVGANGRRPVQSNPEYASRDFNDAGWAVGTAPFGWVKEPSGTIFERQKIDPATTFAQTHEVWMRKWVKCTGDMVLMARVADWGWVYVNGHLVRGDYLHARNYRAFGKPFLYIPKSWLHPSGNQLIAVHVQYEPAWYTSNRMDSLIADLRVQGTYDEKMIL